MGNVKKGDRVKVYNVSPRDGRILEGIADVVKVIRQGYGTFCEVVFPGVYEEPVHRWINDEDVIVPDLQDIK